jgi:hypothetical protein
VNLSSVSVGSPVSQLPIDPTNTSSTRSYYTYTTNGTQFEITSPMESTKYKLGGSNDVIGPDGALLSSVYAKGTNLSLNPIDYGDTSLVGYWPLDEGTGTIAYDWSGNNATGTFTGTQAGTSGYYSAGKIGNWGGSFDGTTTIITANGAFLPTGNNAFTQIVWINPATMGQVGGKLNPNILRWGNPTTQVNNGLALSSNAILHWFFGDDNTWAIPSLVGVWHQIAITYDGSRLVAYLDGISVGSQAPPSTPNVAAGTSLQIGFYNSAAYSFSGLIDDVRIYNRALSGSEIAATYAGGK